MVTTGNCVTMSRRRHDRTLPAGQFKAQCLAVLDEVEAHGGTVIITKRGKPVARVVPLFEASGSLRGSLLYEEDLVGPVDVEWDTPARS